MRRRFGATRQAASAGRQAYRTSRASGADVLSSLRSGLRGMVTGYRTAKAYMDKVQAARDRRAAARNG